MCGLVGCFTRDVRPGLAALLHRGPDGSRTAERGALHLGHARLAIIDVSDRSSQPFERGSVLLVFVGEVWNYREVRAELEALGEAFSTTGDTEVLAAALDRWGEAALSKLDGMFAVAWTQDGQTVRLARDRFGEIPLHVSLAPPFAFSSELKGLAALGCRPASFASVEPGHIATATATSFTSRPYYDAPCAPATFTREEAATELRARLLDGVTLRARAADVPICTLLSGGIDSAAIAWALAQECPSLVGYSAVLDERSPDRRAAREVAEALGIELREVRISPPSADDMAATVRAIEMPHKAQVEIGWPCRALAEQIRADGFKVVFSGEGSDELWASYGFAYHALQTQDWHAYRKALFLSQHRKNFARSNKVFMASGVECRLPFLHPPLVEHALSLTQDVVTEGSRRPKAVMQDAFRSVLPSAIVDRQKLAFQDGLGLKASVLASVADPRAFYAAEFYRAYGRREAP